MLAAAAIILNSFIKLEGISVWEIVISIIFVPAVITSAIHLNFFGMFASLGVIFVMTQKYLLGAGGVLFDWWQVAIVVVLLSISFSLLFHEQIKKRKTTKVCEWADNNIPFVSGRTVSSSTEIPNDGGADGTDDYYVKCQNTFGESVKYIYAKNLQSADLLNSFGEMKVFFDNAELSPDGARVNVENSFGSVLIFIPRSKNWRVENKINTTLGAVEEKFRYSSGDESAPLLTLTGNVQLGAVTIHYM